jgi:hypothetical protein
MPERRLLMTGVVIAMSIAPALLGGQGFAQTRPMPPGHPPPGGALPPGHPPPGGAPDIPAVPPGSGTGAQGLVWTAPSSWKKETPSSSMRRAQYRIPGPGGPAELVVFYFGPGQGGDARANVERWVGQFRRSDGQPIGKGYKTQELKVNGLPAVTVEVAGTYVGGMGGGPSGPEKPDSMLLGAVVAGPDANWFFRAIGPKATLEKERAAFEKMIRSIKRGAAGA